MLVDSTINVIYGIDYLVAIFISLFMLGKICRVRINKNKIERAEKCRGDDETNNSLINVWWLISFNKTPDYHNPLH